jgi:hypothetical protein
MGVAMPSIPWVFPCFFFILFQPGTVEPETVNLFSLLPSPIGFSPVPNQLDVTMSGLRENN